MTALASLAVIMMSCISLPATATDIHGPGSWVEHGVIAAAVSAVAYDSPYRWWVAGAVCAAFLAREETQRGGAFNDTDSNMDWAVPCAVSSGIAAVPLILPDGFGISFSMPW